MTKFVSSDNAAYEVALGITAAEAAEQNLAIVEYSYSTNPPTPIFGRYKDAPGGSPLGITVADDGKTKVVGGGDVSAEAAAANGGANKGALLNPNDPVVHGGTGDETVHADGAKPLADDAAEQQRLLEEGAHDFTAAPKTDKKLAK